MALFLCPNPPKNKNDKCLIGIISCEKNNQLGFKFYNEKKIEAAGIAILDPIDLFDNIQIRDNIRAVVLDIFDFKHPDYPINLKYCQMVAEKLKNLNILYSFISHITFTYLCPLVAANVRTKLDETLLIILLSDEGLLVVELCRTMDGYKVMNARPVLNSPSRSHADMKADILDPCPNYKWIIAVDPSERHPSLMKDIKKSILKSKKLITLTNMRPDDLGKAIAAVVARMDDPSYVDFHIIPRNEKMFAIMYDTNRVFLHNSDYTLPFNESLLVSKSLEPLIVSFSIEGDASFPFRRFPGKMLPSEKHYLPGNDAFIDNRSLINL